MAYGSVPPFGDGAKRLSLKEVARQFETGSSLEEYRTVNLCETSDQLLQQTLATMPKGRSLMESLLKVAQQLQGRAAGRNRDDAALIVDGLQELQTQWQSHEQSAKQAARELTENAASPNTTRFQARITQLQEESAMLRSQVTEKDAIIEQLRLTNQNLRKHADSKPGAEAAVSQEQQPALPQATSPSLLQSLRISGSPELGSTLQLDSGSQPLADVPLQWLRRSSPDAEPVVISGAVRSQYSPEPADVGCTIMCRIGGVTGTANNANGGVLSAESPVTSASGLEEEVAQLARAEATEFCVVPVQHNGQVATKRTVAVLRVTQHEVFIIANGKDIASASYNTDMQVCGARGGGDGAAQGMFLALSGQHVFMLALETPQKRNICIKLLRDVAKKHHVQLDGPQDTN